MFTGLLQNVTVSGAATYGPWYIDTSVVSNWSFIAKWTGTIVGTWKIRAGAGLDPKNTAASPGIFTDETSTFIPAPTNPAGSAGDCEIAANLWTAPFAEISLIVSSGAGTLTFAESGKTA